MAKRLRLFDKQGNPVVFDIGAASVTIDAEGKSLDVKLSELVAAIASAVKSVTFNGNTPTIDAYGNVNLGKQMNPDWNESNPNWPSFIANKPTVPSRTSQLQNDSGFITEDDLPEGVECEAQMSPTSVKPVQNKVIKAYVDNLIAGLIDGAPAALDTLKELATALGNNSDAISAIVNTISSKANASEVVKSISVNGTQQQKDSSGNVNISVAAEVSLDDVFGKVWYDSTNKKIKFYSKDATFNNGVPAQDAVAIAELDATNFIKDGMVQNVSVGDAEVGGETVSCVIITFNVDAGQEDINIPVSQIFDTSLYYTKSQVYTKDETNTALGTKVESVALNGNVLSYTKHGQSTNVATFKTINGQDIIGDGSISIPAGTTPHIDAVSGNWFIGTVDTHVHAQGEKGDSGVASGDGVRVVNDLNGDPADLQQNQVAVLSANMGKELAMGILAGRGSFADADAVAQAKPSTIFPWMLVDVDSNNSIIKKMIWHTGNGAFVDAIGAVISGNKYGVTITSSSAGVLKFKKASSEATASELPFTVGETNYSFAEIEAIWRETNNDVSTAYDGKTISVKSIITDDTTPGTLDIDFGGASVSGIDGPSLYSKLTAIINAKMSINYKSFGYNNGSGDKSRLKTISFAEGSTITTGFMAFRDCSSLVSLDLSKVSGSPDSMQEFLNIKNYQIKTVDIRGLNTRSVANFGGMCRGFDVMTTLIIGNFSTHSATNISLIFAKEDGGDKTNLTLVCTTDTPPEIKQGYSYLSCFSTIKVPNKTIEVDGVQTTVLAQYQAAAVWSRHSSKMSTYEDGEY